MSVGRRKEHQQSSTSRCLYRTHMRGRSQMMRCENGAVPRWSKYLLTPTLTRHTPLEFKKAMVYS